MAVGTRPGRRRNGGQRHGIFVFTGPGGQVKPDEVSGNPLTVRCTWCSAAPGQPCTQLARGGRRKAIHGYHPARRDAANNPTSTTEEP